MEKPFKELDKINKESNSEKERLLKEREGIMIKLAERKLGMQEHLNKVAEERPTTEIDNYQKKLALKELAYKKEEMIEIISAIKQKIKQMRIFCVKINNINKEEINKNIELLDKRVRLLETRANKSLLNKITKNEIPHRKPTMLNALVLEEEKND